MSERVLVTGGAGYLGSVLCEQLLQAGYRVTVIDSLLYSQHSLFHLCAHPRFDFCFGDVRDERQMSRFIADADLLIPLAAIVGAPACDRDPASALTFTSSLAELAFTLTLSFTTTRHWLTRIL